MLCLVCGCSLGQTPVAPIDPNARMVWLRPPATIESIKTTNAETINPVDTPAEAPAIPSPEAPTPNAAPAAPAPPASSIFSRTPFADRNGLAFIGGSGPGRFNIIDFESRPNADRYWWLGRWPETQEVHLYAGLGFNIHWWAGPVSDGVHTPPNLPPQVFDLYLDLSWSQRWSDRLSSEVRARPGMYTDFRTTPPDAFRIPGEAAFVYQITPELYVVGGAQYLQRVNVQLLPIAGFLWQPTPRCEVNLVFPEPKIAYELSTGYHLWGYAAAEYGGGRWTYKNDVGASNRVEYSDVRAVCGIEFRASDSTDFSVNSRRALAFLEAGYVFDRHLRFGDSSPSFAPDPTWIIRLGTIW